MSCKLSTLVHKYLRLATALTLAAVLTGCAVTPGCWIMISIPTFIPSVGCGIDFAPKGEPDAEDEGEEDDDA